MTRMPLNQPIPASLRMCRWPSLLALAVAVQAAVAPAQTVQAPVMGAMKATDVGMEPVMRLRPATYAGRAAQLDAYAVAAADMALARSRERPVRVLAARLKADHARLRRERGSAPDMASDLPGMLAALRSAPPHDFDRLFLAQQVAIHRRAWALHSGYAADGTDARLRAAATRAVPVEEAHLHELPMKPMSY